MKTKSIGLLLLFISVSLGIGLGIAIGIEQGPVSGLLAGFFITVFFGGLEAFLFNKGLVRFHYFKI